MNVKGNEPPVPGYKVGDSREVVRGFHPRVSAEGGERGRRARLENHWCLATDIDMLLRISKEANSLWLGIKCRHR